MLRFMGENSPSSAEDMGSSPGQGTKIPHARELLRPLVTTTEPTDFGAYAKQQEKSTHCNEDPANTQTKTKTNKLNKS